MGTKTLEAIIDENGVVQLLEPIQPGGPFRALVIVFGETKQRGLRPYGLCEGEFVVPDDFDAPLPDEILARFEDDEAPA